MTDVIKTHNLYSEVSFICKKLISQKRISQFLSNISFVPFDEVLVEMAQNMQKNIIQ